jgi:hypothetical protein
VEVSGFRLAALKAGSAHHRRAREEATQMADEATEKVRRDLKRIGERLAPVAARLQNNPEDCDQRELQELSTALANAAHWLQILQRNSDRHGRPP